MLPSVKISCLLPAGPTNSVLKLCTVPLCENGANEPPRYQEMVGTGLPEEKQAMLTESPSCTVTVPFRFMVVGVSVGMKRATKLHGLLGYFDAPATKLYSFKYFDTFDTHTYMYL